ncbi:MAG: hypothetical protein AAB518_03670 [Patescibacteria group bacterium]
MKFQLYNHNYNVQDLVRQMGYKAIGYSEKHELNCVRALGADYPRFHVYLTETPEILTFSLHLDQKKPSYEGTTAHGGDYESETIKEEAQRIKDVVMR